MAHGTPSALKDMYSSDYLEVVPKDMAYVESALKGQGIDYTIHSDIIRIQLNDTIEAISIVDSIRDGIRSFEVRTGTLDDAFVNIIGGVDR